MTFRPCSFIARAAAAMALSFAISVHAAPPAAPTLAVELAGQRLTVNWTTPAGATGHTLYYAPYPHASPVGQLDMGSATSFTIDLPPGAAYYGAVRARNADGESPYSNIVTVFVPQPGAPLQAGDYWEYEWSSTTTSASSSGTSSTTTNGTYRVTLGAAQQVGSRVAFPLVVTGDTAIGRPVWNYIAQDGPVLLGTRDGSVYSTILGSDAGGWRGAGFLAFIRTDLANVATRSTFTGNYRTVAAWAVSRAASSGGCTFYSEIGESVCTSDPSSYSETEYEMPGVGPVGYRYRSSSSFSGGGFLSVHSADRLIELVKSSRIASDGTSFTGSPWTRLPNLATGGWFTGGAAHAGRLWAFGGYFLQNPTPWVQAFQPATGTWSTAASPGAEIAQVIGESNGVLYGIGQVSSTASDALLRLDSATGRWSVVGSAPSFRNPCGGAVLANGNLAVVDCGGTTLMAIYVYNPATARWNAAVSYSAVVLRPAVAAVGNDVYVIGGYSSSAISSRVRIFRSSTNSWQTLSAGMRTPRDGARAVAIGTSLYVMGGRPSSSTAPDGRVVEVFDTTTQAWTAAPPLPEYRDRFLAATLGGAIYIVGGLDGSNNWLATGWRLTP